MKLRSKKIGTAFLAAVMAVTMLPFAQTTAYADNVPAEPTQLQFADKDQLLKFNTDDTDGETGSVKVYFGKSQNGENQQWWIAGSQDGNLTLFAAEPFDGKQSFAENIFPPPTSPKEISYEDTWGCVYDSDPEFINGTHYGGSEIRKRLQKLEKERFTAAEQNLMDETQIYTLDTKNNTNYATRDTLYLSYVPKTGGGDYNQDYIIVGKNSKDDLYQGIRVDQTYYFRSKYENQYYFWTRRPRTESNGAVMYGGSSQGIVMMTPHVPADAVMPAFAMRPSTLSFGSAARPAQADGEISVDTGVDMLDTGGAFTLRYKPSDEQSLGKAMISKDKDRVVYSGVPSEKTVYLVVQNENGAWAKEVSGNGMVASADVDSTLSTFENCKVWLETTDNDTKMTYATLASQTNGHNVVVNLGKNMVVSEGNAVQTDVTGAITDIIIKAESDYLFPADYAVAEQNGITVTRDSEKQITVSGTPTADVNITLPAAAKKEPVTPPMVTYYDVTADTPEHGTISLSKNRVPRWGTVDVTLTPEEGYETSELLVNGKSVGAQDKYTIKDVKEDCHVTAVFKETEEHKNARLKEGVQTTTVKAWSSAGKGWVKVNYKKSFGFKVDGYEIFRSVKKNSGYGSEAFFKTTNKKTTGWYKNTKQLKKGTRYYYKVRGYRTIGDEKVYTKWSNKAIRTAK